MPPSKSELTPTYPLNNQTFTLHTLTPLYHPSPLTEPGALSAHSTRLKKHLTRDSLLPNILPDENVSKLGVLKSCIWSVLSSESSWHTQQENANGNRSRASSLDPDSETGIGLLITLSYETATYSLILLRALQPSTPPLPAEFTPYPLLLTRLPTPLRVQVLDYLSNAFDTRIAPLRLPSSLLGNMLENYLTTLTPSRQPLRVMTVVKDLTLTFAFAKAPGLKNLDVAVPREDVVKFLASANGSTPQTDVGGIGLMRNLHAYLKTHTAMDLGHEDVRLVKVACGAFVLGGGIGEGGRVKILTSVTADEDEGAEEGEGEREIVWRANKGLLAGLTEWAVG
jgi:hypothetical protein